MTVIWTFSAKTKSLLSISKKRALEATQSSLVVCACQHILRFLCLLPKTPSHSPKVSRVYAVWLLFCIKRYTVSQEKLILSMNLCKFEELLAHISCLDMEAVNILSHTGENFQTYSLKLFSVLKHC